jgi:hypothetical protein
VAARQDTGGSVGLAVGVVDIRVISDAIANGRIECLCLADRIGDRAGHRGGLAQHAGMVAVDEFGRAQIEPNGGIGVLRGMCFSHGA